jgi:hypothetical protein
MRWSDLETLKSRRGLKFSAHAGIEVSMGSRMEAFSVDVDGWNAAIAGSQRHERADAILSNPRNVVSGSMRSIRYDVRRILSANLPGTMRSSNETHIVAPCWRVPAEH